MFDNWKTYHPNGRIRLESKIDTRGYKVDIIIYHPNGTLKFKKINANKEEHYYQTGELYMEESKVLGVSTGKKYYDKSGKLLDKF